MRDQASPRTGFIRFSGDGVSALVDQDGRLTFVNVPAIELEPPRSLGQGCCACVDVELAIGDVDRLREIAKALSDPVRVQIVDVLRRQAGEVCVCDLQPLFDISQPTLSHHLKKLRDAGLVAVERRGQWAYYYVVPGALDPLSAWLGQ
jgi:ArsR family transcriptional regulator